jgi:predicted alpha-1,2-mannosidase
MAKKLAPRLLAAVGGILILAAVLTAALRVEGLGRARPQTPRATATPATPALDPVRYVDPFIGTGVGGPGYSFGNDTGNVFPGADFPFGMLQWSPDTTIQSGGYRYADSTIHGFSLTHYSGRGCPNYLDFPFMPALGPLTASPGTNWSAYGAHFAHADETAAPGYYGVHLSPSGIQVALTVTARTGMGTFTYPASPAATLLINAGGSANPDSDDGTSIQIVGSQTVTAQATTGHFCQRHNLYTVYMAAEFDRPFAALGTWNGSALTPGSRASAGSRSGAYVAFDTTANPVVHVKVGLSYVSVADAQANLAAENQGWNFDTVRAGASSAWRAMLDEVQIQGGSEAERTIFYTALYHSLLFPSIFSDANGQYVGFDRQVHTASGYTQYANFSGWDTYRSEIQLLAVLVPQKTSAMVRSLLADAQQGGGGLPRWGAANDNSGDMDGDSGDALIASAYAFGSRNFDAQAALQIMDTAASQPGVYSSQVQVRPGLDAYLSLGYIPIWTDGVLGEASATLEYAVEDFCIAQLAGALGNTAAYARYSQRAENWRTLFNPATGYIEPRYANGAYYEQFSPTNGAAFLEGDSAQYTWLVPQDLPGLFAAMGGNAAVVQRLDQHFTQLNAGPTSTYAFMGNEQEFEAPWEYDFAQAPSGTQSVVRRIILQLYHDTPGGLSGNDDGGALSSWYVWGALGLYPEIPGVAGFALGSPLFPSVTMHLGNGQTLRLVAPSASDTTPYIQSLTLNGQPVNNPWLPFQQLAHGATLSFILGAAPNDSWDTGSTPSTPPYVPA